MNKLFKINKLYTTAKGFSLYHLVFKSRYEMAMFYLRYQEFYESINPEFRGKSFTYLDYMSWYTQFTNAHMFTYHVVLTNVFQISLKATRTSMIQ